MIIKQDFCLICHIIVNIMPLLRRKGVIVMKSKTTNKNTDTSRQTIRSKIIKMAILIAMIPLILSCLISTFFSFTNGKQTAYQQLESRTDSVMQQVQAYVQQGYVLNDLMRKFKLN